MNTRNHSLPFQKKQLFLLICKGRVGNAWNRRASVLRNIQRPWKSSTISSPNPTPHVGLFYSPMLRYCGIRHHECVLPKDCLHLKTSVSLCTRFICVCGWNHVRLWTWTRPGNMIFQLKACVLVKMCICVHVSVVHLKPVLEISSADLWLTPLVGCPIYFRSLWNYISYWYWTPLRQTPHLKDMAAHPPPGR